MFKEMFRKIIIWIMSDVEEVGEQPLRRPNPPGSRGRGLMNSAHSPHPTKSPVSPTIDDMNGLNFTIYSATGGKVVQLSSYDPHTDRSQNVLYIITDKEDLGQELGQIITR